MTVGVGGSNAERELAELRPMADALEPISAAEREARIAHAQQLMREQGVDALYLDASTSLFYFTGIRARQSERLHGAIIPAQGQLAYISPAFEEAKLRESIQVVGLIRTWEEHESPSALVVDTFAELGVAKGTIAIDEATPFFTFDGLRSAANAYEFINGAAITGACRRLKSANELAQMQRAKDITLQVHRATARMLHEGISTEQVQSFIAAAHRRLGVDGALSFCIVLFGEATAYPHGVPYSQNLRDGDMVLIDTGATIDGYHSDITRSYVFGQPSARYREVWDLEKAAQAAAFAAAQIGAPCEAVDAAARRVIEAGGFGPGYAVPGLPHRTGHGIGLDVHEWEYLVAGNQTLLAPGMCFSNEPMICIYGEFGIRLEDHFFMTPNGARWFTPPSFSVDDPFGVEVD
ncbi:MAG: Xaa-Pro dipeptidase [Gammaproteobacteria bacterium]|jgi:Xaa-Pro dipeptidase